jgi:protein-disulfide isomerase
MDKPQYLQYAKDLGLDLKKFEDSINTAHGKPIIDADANEGKSLGVSGTPAFFVNGHFLSGARPFGDFATAINSELTRLKIPIPPAAAAAAPPAPPAGG